MFLGKDEQRKGGEKIVKRIVIVLTVAAMLAVALMATALPAGAKAIRFSSGPCGDVCQDTVVTPSENINQHQHSHPNP